MTASVYSIDDLKLMPRRKRPAKRGLTSAERLRVVVPMDKHEREREAQQHRDATEKFLTDMLRLHFARMIFTIGYTETMLKASTIIQELKPKETAL